MMLLLPDASRMGYRLRLTNYFLTTMTRRTRCVTVAVGATVRTARQLIHPVREDMLYPRLELAIRLWKWLGRGVSHLWKR
jgi:hypothetical protein